VAGASTGGNPTAGASQSSNNLAPSASSPVSQSTIGNSQLRQPAPGSTEPPAISSSQSTSPNVTGTPVASGFQTPECDLNESPLYCVYTVETGDNLSKIAAKFGIKGNEDVTPWEMLVQSNKPDIASEDDLLQIGQKLRIPMFNGVVHTVLRAQTLIEIADQFGVTPEAIMAIAANNLGDADDLSIGQELIIPGPTRFAAPAPVVAPTTPAAGGGSSGGSSGTARNSGPRSSSGFMWPTTGPISSYFGPAHPLGIDIDLFSNPNAPIGASAAGVVTFAGGNTCCSYGLYVIVDHGNGIQTLYAHLSKISVSTGERVAQGQIIGNGGRTGYATGNHLHFEVHVNGAYANPLDFMP